jgi:hypothetical protein
MLFATVEELAKKQREQEQGLVDARTPEKAVASLLSPAMPLSPWEQMREKHGTGESILRMIGTGLSGGLLGDALMPEMGKAGQAKYATDLKAYQAAQDRGAIRQEQADFIDGLDFNNLSLSQMAQLGDFDEGLGKLAMEDFTFNQRVKDLGRANEFANDGIDDENDLWATETFGRYGKTAGGDTTSLDAVLGNAKMTKEEFKDLPAEAQRSVLYQHGTDEDRAAMDRVAGRQTLDQIEAEGAAKGIGEASGAQTAEAVGFLPNAPQIAKDQDYAIAGAQGVIDLIKGGDIDTGKWANMVKDTFNVQTKADGTLGYQATQALIAQINSATFGALSEREIETLEKMFANGSYNEEANLGIMEGVMGKLNHEKEKHGRKTEESIRRVKKFAPDEYEYFMQDDNNWLQYGEGSKLPESEGGMSFADAWPMMQQDGLSRDEAVVQWRDELKAEKEAAAQTAKVAEENRQRAGEAINEMTDWASTFAGDR